MTVWRLHQADFEPHNFTGAMLYGGRYNSIGNGALYTSSSASGTILELRVHLKRIPAQQYKMSTCRLNKSLLRKFRIKDIPSWNNAVLGRPQAFGDMQLADPTIPGFLAPSVTSSGMDSMVVLNPIHPAFTNLIWTSVDFEFDTRLWVAT